MRLTSNLTKMACQPHLRSAFPHAYQGYACVSCVPGSPRYPHPLTRLCAWRLPPARTQRESEIRRSRPALPDRRGGRGGRLLSPAPWGGIAVDRPRGQLLGDQLHFYHSAPARAGALRRESKPRVQQQARAQQRLHASFSAHHHSLMQLQHRHRPTSVPPQTRASRRRQGTRSGRSSCTNALSDRTSGLQAPHKSGSRPRTRLWPPHRPLQGL